MGDLRLTYCCGSTCRSMHCVSFHNNPSFRINLMRYWPIIYTVNLLCYLMHVMHLQLWFPSYLLYEMYMYVFFFVFLFYIWLNFCPVVAVLLIQDSQSLRKVYQHASSCILLSCVHCIHTSSTSRTQAYASLKASCISYSRRYSDVASKVRIKLRKVLICFADFLWATFPKHFVYKA